ncbi:hypothetical protein DENSPDRAFT_886885 [Dentipellis sp. KUC8613]|nr:hypothetical protein DENSPDRAFT_886885 [Dentipellis sp. KUC8613]
MPVRDRMRPKACPVKKAKVGIPDKSLDEPAMQVDAPAPTSLAPPPTRACPLANTTSSLQSSLATIAEGSGSSTSSPLDAWAARTKKGPARSILQPVEPSVVPPIAAITTPPAVDGDATASSTTPTTAAAAAADATSAGTTGIASLESVSISDENLGLDAVIYMLDCVEVPE